MEIRKSSTDNQQNQKTLILEITQEHFLSCVGPKLPLSCACVAPGANLELCVSTSPPLCRKKPLAQNSICLLWKIKPVCQGRGTLSETQNQLVLLPFIHEKWWQPLKSSAKPVGASHYCSSLDMELGTSSLSLLIILKGNSLRKKQGANKAPSPNAEQAGRNSKLVLRTMHIAQEWFLF